MAKKRITEFKPVKGYEILNPRSQAEVEQLLAEMYPNNIIKADDIYEKLTTVGRSIIKSDLGVRNYFTPKELAAYLWGRSNYHAIENDPFNACQ